MKQKKENGIGDLGVLVFRAEGRDGGVVRKERYAQQRASSEFSD